ncbi:putative membrane protein [Clostridium botulinum A str. ATCC 3502]|uniref:Membrane protein n=1 Tax=Clostridium botulinum (strain Hall / ATCC 3502 / NCTC 13319 / Type A) TaxID=441771 RepID=A5HZC3_CLOBH|nr:putative membrane protein [Clostridium botulinum A str. ATCC 3502]
MGIYSYELSIMKVNMILVVIGLTLGSTIFMTIIAITTMTISRNIFPFFLSINYIFHDKTPI